jgi:hypothetical protein
LVGVVIIAWAMTPLPPPPPPVIPTRPLWAASSGQLCGSGAAGGITTSPLSLVDPSFPHPSNPPSPSKTDHRALALRMPFKTIKLNDGREIPAIGFGTWKIPKEVCAGEVEQAIEVGFDHVDTAQGE